MKLINNVLYLIDYNLEQVRVPILHNYLKLYWSYNKVNAITAPSNIKNKTGYLRGLRLYLLVLDSNIPDLNEALINLTERDIYYMAVIAYEYRDTTPLVKLDLYLNRQGDKYFWLYLAHNPEIFYYTMNIELVRRKTYPLSSLKVYDLTNATIKYRPFNDPQGFINKRLSLLDHGRRVLQGDKARSNNNEINKNFFNGALIETIPTHRQINDVVDMILNIEGVIVAGGYVNHLLNENHTLIDVYNLLETLPGPIAVTHFKKNQRFEEANASQIYDLFVGLHNNNQNLLRQLLGSNNYNFVLTEEAKRMIDQLIVNNPRFDGITWVENRPYMRFRGITDIDVFFTREEAAFEVFDLLTTGPYKKREIFSTEFSTSIGNIRYNKPQIQLIKRLYDRDNGKREILAGFDLDPSRVLLYKEQGVLKCMATESYTKSVELGITVVVPSRQSFTLTKRIIKYRHKGF